MELPIRYQLNSGLDVALDLMAPTETETVRSLFNAIVAEGTSYPQQDPLSPPGFADYWLKGKAYVVRSWGATKALAADNGGPTAATITTEDSASVLGAFYIKPNFPGRCGHICNAGFIVAPAARGKGLGRLMGEAMVSLARDLGYRAVMYNLVFATNIPSLKIWQALDFQEIGRIPQAAHLPDGTYVDAIMLYKSLV
ncbi:MAG: GNAT family N-acetyltransferase [Leptolyngbya sp.]|nr:GNAT family N-acetyltransferase [Leptolyngbya sp.]